MDDIEIINNVNKFSFNYLFNEIFKNQINIDTLVNYINLFLSNNNTNLFIKDSNDNIDKYINSLNYILYNFNLKLEYKKIIINILLNNNLINKNNFNNFLLEVLINDYELLNTFFEKNPNLDIFLYLITSYDNEKKMYNYFNNLIELNLCRNKSQNNENDFKIIKTNENLLYNILDLLLNFWNKIIKYEYNKCSNIKNYIINFNINNNIIIDKYSNYFFIILKLINVTIFYNISKETELRNILKIILTNKENIDNLENNIWNDFLNMKHYYNDLLDNKYKTAQQDINKINKLLKNEFLHKIKLFYNNFINQIDFIITDKNNKIINKYILQYLENTIDFSTYCTNRKIFNKKNDFNLMLFFFKIINNKLISNFNINQKSIDFLLYYIIANISYIKKEISFINYDIITIFYKNIISFYIELDNYEDYSRNDTKYKIIYIIRLLSKTNKNENIFTNIFVDIIKQNNNNTIKFLNSIITDINFYLEELILYIKNSNNYILLIKTLYSILTETLNFIKYFSNVFTNIIFNDIIINNFINIINLHVKNIIKSDLNIFNITNNYNLSHICTLIINIYLILHNNNPNKFIQIMSKDIRSFDIKIYQQLLTLLNNNNKIDNQVYKQFQTLLLDINNLYQIELDKLNYNIPDELTDPICQTLIENPVCLPSGTIVDLLVIQKNLLISNTDPFTRKSLTMEQINEYNKKPEIIQKIEEFKIKIKIFKNQNNLL